MKVSEFLELVGSADSLDALKEVLPKVIEDHKDLIGKIGEKNNENKAQREQAEALQKQMDELLTAVKAQKPEEVIEKATSGEQASLANKKLMQDLEALQKQVDEIKQAKEQETQKALKLEVTDKIKSALEELEVKKGARSGFTDLLSNRYSKDEQGEFVTSEGKRLSDDIKAYFEDKPDFIQNNIPQGAGIRKPSDRGQQNVKVPKSPSEKQAAMLELIQEANKQ